jgi:hypothetical protein
MSTGRSAWLPLGMACLSAWIERRSGKRPHALNRFALARRRFIAHF